MAENTGTTLNDRLAEAQSRPTGSQAPKTTPTRPQGEEPKPKSMMGYRIVIILLIVVLGAVSAFYFNINSQQEEEYALLVEDRSKVQDNLDKIITEFDDLETNNEELKLSMEIERNRADSIITQLKKERSFNYTKLKKYEQEVGTLRTIMRGYLQQIDSLNNLNQQLISENVSYKKQISNVELRAEEAEERAKELNNKVKEGSKLRAEGVSVVGINSKGKEMSRVKRADRLSINFTVVPNELAAPGNKEIYARVTSPDGYVLTTEELPTFDVNGEKLTYTASREVDYQNESLAVSIFFAGTGFVDGTYKVELYYTDYMIGSSEVTLR